MTGGDIFEMKELTLIEGGKFLKLANKVFRKLENLDKSVIAAINGFALAGVVSYH